jgi:hypothetical protein
MTLVDSTNFQQGFFIFIINPLTCSSYMWDEHVYFLPFFYGVGGALSTLA